MFYLPCNPHHSHTLSLKVLIWGIILVTPPMSRVTRGDTEQRNRPQRGAAAFPNQLQLIPAKGIHWGNPLETEMVWFLVLNLEILRYGIDLKKREMQGGKS